MPESTYKPSQYHKVKFNCAGIAPDYDQSNEPKCPFFCESDDCCALLNRMVDALIMPDDCPLRKFEITVMLQEE